MKTIRTIIAVLALMISLQSAHAQASDKTQRTIGIKTTSIQVAGDCHMAGNTIEKIASRVDGIKAAAYNEEKQLLTLKYDVFKKDALEAVQRKIAAAGFDTEKFKASDSAYEKSACCCQQRKSS